MDKGVYVNRFLAIVIALALVVFTASIVTGTTEHCPEGGIKVEVPQGASGHSEDIVVEGVTVTVTIDGDTVTFTDEAGDPIEVTFCIKSSNEAFDGMSGSSGTTPDGQDISYVTVFALVDEEETPTPTPEPTLEPTPLPEVPTGGGTVPDTAMPR